MYVAFAYFELRQTGELVLPILGLPDRVRIIDAPTIETALITCALLSAVLGLVIYFAVFKWLRTAPALARVVASLGLLLYFEAIVKLRFTETSATQLNLGPILPGGSSEWFGVTVPNNRFMLAGLAVLVALVLRAVFRHTRFGLATRAAAENEKGVLLLGHSPDRLAAINWMVASLLAGVSVILIVSVTRQLDPLVTSLLVVPALAAALFGGLRSFVVTALAGLGIGMAQSAILNFNTQTEWLPSWIPQSGFQQALPFLLIVVALTVRGETLPGRSTILESRLPNSPRPRFVGMTALILSGATLIGLLTLDSQWRLAIVVSMIAALIALSSVVLTGYVGQISLAQFAFAGVAGFGTAKLVVDAGIPFPWAPMIAVAITTALGLLVGLPAVRVRGMTLAVATLGAAVAIEALLFQSSALGGLEGEQVPPPTLFGIDLGFFARGSENFRPAFGIFVLVVLVVVFLAVANLRRSPTGLRWLAVRANERAAAASGINVPATKLSAFAVSSLIAGLGGVLLGYSAKLDVAVFAVFAALALLALTYLGGIAAISGAVIAGILTPNGILTQMWGGEIGGSADFQFAASGLALIAMAILYPDGISGAARRALERRRGLRQLVSNNAGADARTADSSPAES